MASLRTVEATIGAGNQFLGTEFKIGPMRPGNILLLYEVDLKMGSEAKTWEIRKVLKGGVDFVTLLQSIDPSTGAPAATTDSSVVGAREDVAVLLEPGDQIQIVTTSATSAMFAKLYVLEGLASELLAMRGD